MMYRKAVSFTLAFCVLGLMTFTYHWLTEGFSTRQIVTPKGFKTRYTPQHYPQMDHRKLESIVSQTFYYKGKGCQFYVFESADHQYVLKFFKQKHFRLSPLSELCSESSLAHWLPKKLSLKRAKLDQLIRSCELSGTRLARETGVIYIHMNHAPECSYRTTLRDKLGIAHRIDLQNYDFVIQKKALDAVCYFSSLSLKDPIRVKRSIYQIIDLYRSRCQHHVIDRDFACLQNLGYLENEDRFQMLDFGQLEENSRIHLEEYTQRDIIERLLDLEVWSQKHLPALSPIVQEVIHEMDR